MLKKISLALLLLIPFISIAQEMWINEIHYDNTGGDVDEFVEVVIQDNFAGNLADVEIVFYNGSGGGVYLDFNPHPLSDFATDDVSVNGFKIYAKLISGIQNGNPDGLALVNNGTVVEFLSYEGSITAVGGPADGMTSVDIGVFGPGPIGDSLQLSGTGNTAQLFTWLAPAQNTMGSINNGQVFGDAFPRVISVFPSNGTSGVDTTIPLDIVFSEPVNVTNSSFSIACPNGPLGMSGFDISQIDNTHYILTPNSGNPTFPYWPGNDTCTVTMIASQITDLDGSNKPLDGNSDGSGGDDFTFSFNTTTDILPKVVSVTPVDGEVLVAENSDITITFSEIVNLSSVNAINLDCQGSVAFNGLPISNVSSVTITPINPFQQGDICTVTLVASFIKDIDSNADPLDGNGDGVPGDNYVFGFSVIEEIMPIYNIQGNGEDSPIVDSFIRTSGNIVTALTGNGFYMQSPNPGDGDDETSDGLFVFSGEAVSLGDGVSVRGKVVEFFGMTELTNVSSVVIDSNGNALPPIIPFGANTPSQLPPVNRADFDNRLERFEGMLVSVANGIANGGTQYNGKFSATATGERALREPGVEFSQTGDSQLPYDLIDPNATPTSYAPDIFDENPELFEVDTNGLDGMPIIDINGGSTFEASGVLSYSFGSYTLLPKIITTVNKPFVAIDTPAVTEITVATQNMYRFFDDVDDLNNDDFEESNPSIWQVFPDRVSKASLYFRTIMHAPDIIVLTEVENHNSIQTIADQITTDDGTLTYTAHLIEGQDFGGIDIGFLTKSTVGNITITQLGADETIAFETPTLPDLPFPLHDRPPLLLNAIVTKGGISREINVLGLHMRSRSGITQNKFGKNGSDRERIRNKHLEQALSVANMVQNLQSPTAALVVIGDFNDFEFSDGYADVIGEIKGDVDTNRNLLSSNGISVVNPTLINAVDTLAPEEKYSFIFRGTIQALDHALVNDVGLAYLSKTTFVRGNVDAPEKFEEDYTQTLNMSDHDGLMLYLDIDTVLETIFLDGFED